MEININELQSLDFNYHWEIKVIERNPFCFDKVKFSFAISGIKDIDICKEHIISLKGFGDYLTAQKINKEKSIELRLGYMTFLLNKIF